MRRKQSKDEYIRQMSEEQRNLRREKDQLTDAEREYKATMADEAYRQWLDLKVCGAFRFVNQMH